MLEKTKNAFENEAVTNPATIEAFNSYHLFYRSVSKGNHSTIGYCKLSSPLEVETRNTLPLIVPEYAYEMQGMEDPRIVKIDDYYYITYTGYDGTNAQGALARSTDLVNFEKLGVITPKVTYAEFEQITNKYKLDSRYALYNKFGPGIKHQNGSTPLLWDKDVILFPRKINNQFYFLHRIKPDIQLVAVDQWEDLTPEFWQKYFLDFSHNIILSPRYNHEISYVGGGCPPIETAHGWLIIYHGVEDSPEGYIYSACAALLDLNNPFLEISRLPYVLFKPEETWELMGEVNNVCFPTGTLLVDDTLFIYYGAADTQIACASLSLSALIEELINNKSNL